MTSLVDEGQAMRVVVRKTDDRDKRQQREPDIINALHLKLEVEQGQQAKKRTGIDRLDTTKEGWGSTRRQTNGRRNEHSKFQDRETVFYPTPSHPVVLFCFF